jgi:hypothetical protein
VAYTLSSAEIEQTRALATLEKARESCIDSGVQKVIQTWMDEVKKKLAEED